MPFCPNCLRNIPANECHSQCIEHPFAKEAFSLRTALEFYSHEARYDPKDGWLALDRGAKAREALKR